MIVFVGGMVELEYDLIQTSYSGSGTAIVTVKLRVPGTAVTLTDGGLSSSTSASCSNGLAVRLTASFKLNSNSEPRSVKFKFMARSS